MSAAEPTIRLDSADLTSPTWGKVQAYLARRLEKARKRNDGPLDNDETLALRGEIKALKGLLALGKESPPAANSGGGI